MPIRTVPRSQPLDHIGVFDRSQPLPTGGHLEQADGTAWMAFYCATMLSMALELAREDASYEDIELAEHAIEKFLRSLGFELETRAAPPDRTGSLRPIFRSAEAVPYATLRERLQRVEQALREAASASHEPPLQGTGTSGAHEVALALARLRHAALVVGPVALVRRDENPGELHLAVRPPALARHPRRRQPRSGIVALVPTEDAARTARRTRLSGAPGPPAAFPPREASR